MQRTLCVAAAALAFLCLASSAEARTPAYARTKCVGLYCMIVSEPDPQPPPRPATWRKGWAPRRSPKRRARPRRSPDLLRRAAAIARKQPWCDPKRVAECHGCRCRREARGDFRSP